MAGERDLVTAALSGYDLGEELGRGGWGIVYSATHRLLRRHVAVKVLPRAFAADPDVRSRFREEARLAAQLNHPHVVQIFDCIEAEGLLLFVMERMQRRTLWNRFAEDGVLGTEACAVLVAVCGALDQAHRTGRVHRDVKPDNVLFDFREVPKLSDFGVAKIVGYGRSHTRVGEVVGTPAYMSPEQATGKAVGAAADVYSTAVMGYELLSGRLPFDATDNPMTQLYRQVHEPPLELSLVAPGVGERLAAVVMRGLAKEPADRYGSADAFAVALARAASETFGTEWLRESGLVVQLSDRVASAMATVQFEQAIRHAPSVARASIGPEGHLRVGTAFEPAAVDVEGFGRLTPSSTNGPESAVSWLAAASPVAEWPAPPGSSSDVPVDAQPAPLPATPSAPATLISNAVPPPPVRMIEPTPLVEPPAAPVPVTPVPEPTPSLTVPPPLSTATKPGAPPPPAPLPQTPLLQTPLPATPLQATPLQATPLPPGGSAWQPAGQHRLEPFQRPAPATRRTTALLLALLLAVVPLLAVVAALVLR